MKPDRIVLFRHGISTGNVDKTIYQSVPDYALTLTPEGREGVKAQAIKLKEIIGADYGPGEEFKVAYYVSPFHRARQTYLLLRNQIPAWKTYEDLRLREQEWTTSLQSRDDNKAAEAERDSYGHTYWRFKDAGESCADVYDRVSDLLNSVHREFEKPDYPSTAIFVTHGMTMRVFLMRWLHLTVEEFELLANPKNAEFIILERQSNGRYSISDETPVRKYPEHKHKFQFDWNDPLYQ